MNAKRIDNNYDKMQAWRLYNPDINKPKINYNKKSASLSPIKQKENNENKRFSPNSKFIKIGSNLINQNSQNNPKSVNNILQSSGGHVFYNYPNQILKDKNINYNINPLNNINLDQEDSKEHFADNHDNTISYKDTKYINEKIDLNNLHNCNLK